MPRIIVYMITMLKIHVGLSNFMMRHTLEPQPIMCSHTPFVDALIPDLPLPLANVMARSNAYYYANHRIFGEHGDFITAPDISQIFGEVLAIWCLTHCTHLGTHTPTILECGPGRGTLMADMIRIFQKIPHFNPSILLLEKSPTLREQQKNTLNDASYSIQWCADLDEVHYYKKPNTPLLVMGNEFLDALPTQPYIYKVGIWHRVDVACVKNHHDNVTLSYVHTPLHTCPQHLPHSVPEGAVYEDSPTRVDFMKQAYDLTQDYGGALCFIDYGDCVDPRFGDTFQAVKQHTYVHPLAYLGECDLTTHVDFQAMCHVVSHAMVSTQAEFLQRYGYAQCLEKNIQSCMSHNQKTRFYTAAQRLIDPHHMGLLFKVCEIT